MSQTDPADIPHDLDLVIDYVNTLDHEAASDALGTPDALARWLSEHGVLAAGARLSASQHAQAVELREALRALMLANNGGEQAPDAWSVLERTASAGGLGLHFAGDGRVRMVPDAEGFAGALARLLVPIAASVEDGSWRRAKACQAGDCRWAFYDRSRNRSARWCEMAVCGNRTKVRAFRKRR